MGFLVHLPRFLQQCSASGFSAAQADRKCLERPDALPKEWLRCCIALSTSSACNYHQPFLCSVRGGSCTCTVCCCCCAASCLLLRLASSRAIAAAVLSTSLSGKRLFCCTTTASAGDDDVVAMGCNTDCCPLSSGTMWIKLSCNSPAGQPTCAACFASAHHHQFNRSRPQIRATDPHWHTASCHGPAAASAPQTRAELVVTTMRRQPNRQRHHAVLTADSG